ncbi:unnamed protein product [Brassica oleracea]
MKPNVEPSLFHVSTHKRIRVYPIFFSRRELTNETTNVKMTTSTKKDSKTEQHQAATAALPLLQVAATTAAVTRTTNTL